MNKLLEVYSKGLFNSLTNEQVGDVVELVSKHNSFRSKKGIGRDV